MKELQPSLINTSSPVRYLPDQKGGTRVVPTERRGVECLAGAYPELKSLV